MEQTVNPGARNPLAAYQSAAAHGGVAAADPHRLVTLLFDTSMDRITAAIGCIEQGEFARKARLLHHATTLIAELRGSLNLAQGGELAANLDALYEYMIRRVLLANANNDPGPLREVLRLIAEVRSGWVAIGPQVSGAHSGAGRPGAAPGAVAAVR